MQTKGIHHVTAVAGDPRSNLDFYIDVLGLRLVKRTVNFDDTSTDHFYYADRRGTPGFPLTFFPFGHIRGSRPGRRQVTRTSFVVPEPSLEYWIDRFEVRGVEVDPPRERFGETVLFFRDPDGLPPELIATGSLPGTVEPWDGGPVPEEHAIRGFHGVTLHSGATEETRAVSGAGTVRHVAFRVPDEETQDEWRERLLDAGLRVTEPKDRHYFRSTYFREPGVSPSRSPPRHLDSPATSRSGNSDPRPGSRRGWRTTASKSKLYCRGERMRHSTDPRSGRDVSWPPSDRIVCPTSPGGRLVIGRIGGERR